MEAKYLRAKKRKQGMTCLAFHAGVLDGLLGVAGIVVDYYGLLWDYYGIARWISLWQDIHIMDHSRNSRSLKRSSKD